MLKSAQYGPHLMQNCKAYLNHPAARPGGAIELRTWQWWQTINCAAYVWQDSQQTTSQAPAQCELMRMPATQAVLK